MKAVLNPDTNEVLGFDDNMSDDEIFSAIKSDKDGRPRVDVNPSPYEAIIRPALERSKLTGNKQFLYDAKRRAAAEDPFRKAFVSGLTFGLTNQEKDPERIAAYGPQIVLGDLAGQTTAIIGTMGLGELIGLSKLAGAGGAAAMEALPKGVQTAVVGSGKILPVTAGEAVSKVTAGVIGSSLLGGLYNGILESVRQGKSLFPDDEGYIHQTAPDLVKVGQEILHGAVSWAPYGVGATFVPKTGVGVATGTAAIAGTAYAVSRAEGHSDTDARMNAILMSIFHFTMTAGKIGKESPEIADLKPKDNIVRDKNGDPIEINALTPETNAKIVEDLGNAISNYTAAKNGMTEGNNVHRLVGDEMIKSEAQAVVEQANLDISAKEPYIQYPQANQPAEVKSGTEAILRGINRQEMYRRMAEKKVGEPEIKRQFEDPYDGAMLDYLATAIPPKEVARLSGEERLKLANLPWKELQDISRKYETGELPEKTISSSAEAERMISEGSPVNPVAEVVKSGTLTRKLVENVTTKFIQANEKPTTPEASAKGRMGEKPSTQEIGEPEAKSIVESGRGEFKAIDRQGEEPLVYFNTPGGGTVTVPLKGITREAVEARIKKFEDAGGRKTPMTPEQKAKLLKGEKITEEPNIPRENTGNQQPVENSTKSESGLSQSVESSAVEKGLIEDLGSLPSYEKRNMSEIAKQVEAFIAKDAELAKQIALGEKPEQEGLRAQELFTGLRVKAEQEGDVGLIRELALSEKAAAMATELGQRVKALDSGGEESAVEAIRDIQKTREETATKKVKSKDLKKEKAEVVDEIKKSIKKRQPKITEWNDFLESLRC